MFRFGLGLLLMAVAFVLFWVWLSYRKRAKAEAAVDTTRRSYEFSSADKASGVGIATTITLILGLLFIVWSTVRIVPANAVGIPTEVGKIQDPINSGFHFVKPWTKINTFSTRVQELSMLRAADEGDKAKDDSIEVRGSDGYKMNVDITIRYFINPASAAKLFRLYGSEDGIKQGVVRPEARESVRIAFAKFTSEEGYTNKREPISADVFADIQKRIARYGLTLDTVNLHNVAPDPTLAQAISDRAAAREKALQANIEQERLQTEAQTRLNVAKTDAETAREKAAGEADANVILADSVTPELLELKRLEALAKANTIYVPDNAQILVGAGVK
jgi:regulator of protease activity HflC (stomatin/prohibitin superfamily)